MAFQKNSLGFTAAEGMLIVVIFALISIVGYKVYDTKHSTDKINSDTVAAGQQASLGGTSSAPAAINSTSDLDKAQSSLDSYDASASDTSDSTLLDSQLSSF